MHETNTPEHIVATHTSAHVALNALGLGELVDSPEYAANSARMENRESFCFKRYTYQGALILKIFGL